MNTIYLIGLMGVGKTSAGRLLSNLTNKSFIDLDYEIEKASGLTVANFFKKRGESSFRLFESKLLKSFSKSIISCGGGVVLSSSNREFLKKNGKVILLTASLHEIEKRLVKTNTRPLLNNKSIKESLGILWKKREKDYHDTADLIVDTDNKSVQQVANELRIIISEKD